MIYAILALSGLNLAGVVFLIIQYLKEFKLTRKQVQSVNSEIRKMRETPPRIRTPYEERLKAEYAKRGMHWETTGR